MIILAYHRVNPEDRSTLSVRVDAFRRQLEYLLERGWHNVSLSDVATGLVPARLREPTFAITFDDGYRDNYMHAMPVLRDLALTATVFVTVDYIGRNRIYAWDVPRVAGWGGQREEDLSVTWEHIREMESSGTFSIGSHTLSHPRLATISPAELEREVRQSRQVLEERLAHPVPLFCYPYGNLNRRVVRAVRNAEYALAVVTPPRPVPRGRYTLPRIGIYGHMTFADFERKAGLLYQTLLWSGALPYIQTARIRLRNRA